MQNKSYWLVIMLMLAAFGSVRVEGSGKAKGIYIPRDLRSMNLDADTAQWSYARMDTTLADIAIFWQKGFGSDLSNAPQLDGHDMSVDIANLKRKLNSYYTFFRDTLAFVRPGSKTEQYRMMVMLNYSLEGTAYGGDYDETIGALWIAPNRVKDSKLNCIAHELGHSFQSQITCDGEGEAWGGCGFFEMASQWMLWQVNPDWVTDEYYHLDAFRRLTHKAFLHLDNIYHSPYILQYWAERHGRQSIAQLFRDGRRGEDPAMTYMRTNNLTQQQFCDEMFDASRRIVNFDFRHAYAETRRYAALFANTMEQHDGWLYPKDTETPEAYGFNVIPLALSKKVKLEFEGHSAVNTVRHLMPHNKEYAPTADAGLMGWRYGIVEITTDGKAIYGDMHSEPRGRLTYRPTKDAARLFLVVMGAPRRHIMNPEPDEDGHYSAEFQKFPYRIKQ